jgi:hypothetical protein
MAESWVVGQIFRFLANPNWVDEKIQTSLRWNPHFGLVKLQFLIIIHIANWKDPPFLRGKSTINGNFQWLC